jgi:peptidyl-prolyl cis-trans isomerase A (cyclophilin A)
MENGIYAKFNTTKRCYFSKTSTRFDSWYSGEFVGLAEGNLENKVKPKVKFYDGLNFIE